MGIVWALLSSLLAIGLEVIYKSTQRSWVALLPITIIPILALNYTIFRLLRGNGLLTAFVLFGLCNLVARITVAVLYLREPVSTGIWIALGLLFLANLAKWSVK